MLSSIWKRVVGGDNDDSPVKHEAAEGQVFARKPPVTIDMTDLTDSDEEEERKPVAFLTTPPRSIASLLSDSAPSAERGEPERKEPSRGRTCGTHENSGEASVPGEDALQEVEFSDHKNTLERDDPYERTSFQMNEEEGAETKEDWLGDEDCQVCGYPQAEETIGTAVSKPDEDMHMNTAERHGRKKKKKDKKKKKKEKSRIRKALVNGRSSRLYEVSVPTETELLLHSRMNIPLAPFATKSSEISRLNALLQSLTIEPTGMSELSFAINWRSLIPKNRRRRGIQVQNLRIPISIINRRKPVLILYDQVEPADEKRQGCFNFQHGVLPGGNNRLFDNLSPGIERQRKKQPCLKEWYPHDPEEYILNVTEQELVWLFEESRYCFGGDNDDSLDWEFIWEYASPALKFKLRPFGDTDNTKKYTSLVRWNEPLVEGRMRVVRKYVAGILRQGFRRLHLRRVLATLRLQKPCDTHGRRLYPIPDYAAATNERYHYSTPKKEPIKPKGQKHSTLEENEEC